MEQAGFDVTLRAEFHQNPGHGRQEAPAFPAWVRVRQVNRFSPLFKYLKLITL
jgi:hypothetical protein